MSTIENVFRHFWKPMEKFQVSEVIEGEDLVNGSSKEKIDLLKKMQPNQYVSISFIRESKKSCESYIQELSENGLDVGKGDCEYGFKMPLTPGKRRELIIFRRHL